MTEPRREPDFGQIQALARKLQSTGQVTDTEHRRQLARIVRGKTTGRLAVAPWRRILRHVRDHPDMQLSKPLRVELDRWAAAWGLQVRGDKVRSVRVEVALDEEEHAAIQHAARRERTTIAELMRRYALIAAGQGTNE